MTLGAYPLGTTALGAKETPEPILTIQKSWINLFSDNVALQKILVIQNTAHGLMSDIAEIFAFTANPNRTHQATRAHQTSSKAEKRTTQPTNNRTIRI